MPKYSYICKECDYRFFARHGIKETFKKCPECKLDNSLLREINKVAIKKTPLSTNSNIGDLTKKFIEENRDVLKSYKEDLEGASRRDIENISS